MSKYLDTRDLYKRKCELEELKEAVETTQEELSKAKNALDECDTVQNRVTFQDFKGRIEELEEAVSEAEINLTSAQIDFGNEEQEELAELEELESEISDFMHGETMIPVNDFEDYAEQLAEDIGAIDRNASWPLNCIDWEQAAKELAMDYTEVTYQGESYYVRS